ncbi:spindle and centriole-associated protein 1 [Rhinoderma darwinii]|uniref:spindle and centriole-associated protein 1 n=1 Tax=Rhinoderma darwinii TaxID=43563 RepID=UPI003F67EA80
MEVHRILNDESCRLPSERWSRDKALNVENQLVTPKAAGHPPNGQIALNATTAVNKVKTRLTEEEQEEPETSSVIGRVLNPQPTNHRKLQSKGKKRLSLVSSSHRAEPAFSTTCELSSCGQSSLDVLNHMIQEVESELETYERETGREVSAVPQCQGLTGFTLSLVSSIRRLVSYLKESDRQLRQESLERQRLRDELREQRLLIDALTVEILAIKDGSSMSTTSHRLMSEQSQSPPGETTASLTMARPEQTEAPNNSKSSPAAGFMTEPGSQSVEYGDSAAPLPGEDVSSITQITSLREAGSLLDFQPAVLLSPPRQKTRSDFRDQASSLHSSHGLAPSSSGDCKDFSASRPDPATQRWTLPSRAQSLPCAAASHPLPQGDALVGHHHTEHNVPESEETSATKTDNDIVSRMAELTCQNNALKAQLKQLSYRPGRAGDNLGASQVAGENKQEVSPVRSPVTLEMRIAELNRQSAAARDKLLRLIEQQKQSQAVSPAISPITPQQEEPGRRVRAADAVLPMPQFTDSSTEWTPSPGSGRRSSASPRSSSSATGSSRGGRAMTDGQRVKVGKDKEEGWFALSTHVA